MGSVKAAAEGLLRSKPEASSFAAMSSGVMSAMAALLRRCRGCLRLAVGAAKLRTGIALGAVVARRRAGVDRRAALLREQQVPATGAHHLPALVQGELDQRSQPLVAARQFMRAGHGRPLPRSLGR